MDQAAVRITLSASSNAPTYTGGPFAGGVAQMNTRRTVAGWGSEWVISVGAFGESVDLSLGGNYAQLSSSSLTIAAGTWWASLRGAGGAVEGALVEIGTLTTGGTFTVMWTGYARAVSCDGLALSVECESALSQRHKSVPTYADAGSGVVSSPLVYGNRVESKVTTTGIGIEYIDIGARSTVYHYDRAKPTDYSDTHFPGGNYTSAVKEVTQLSATSLNENIEVSATVAAGSITINRDVVAFQDKQFIYGEGVADLLPKISTVDSAFDWESRIADGNLFFEVDNGTTKVYVKIDSFASTTADATIEQMIGDPSPDWPGNANNFGDVFYDVVGSGYTNIDTVRTRTFLVSPPEATQTGKVRLFAADVVVSSDTETFGIDYKGLYVPFTETSPGSKMWRVWNYNLGNLSLYTCPWVPAISLSGSNRGVISDGTSATSFHIDAYYARLDTPAFAALFQTPTNPFADASEVYFFIDASMQIDDFNPLVSNAGITCLFQYINEMGVIISSQTIEVVRAANGVSSASINNYPASSNYDSGSYAGFAAKQIKLTVPNGTTDIRVTLGCALPIDVQPGYDLNALGSMTVRQMTIVPVFAPIWDTISSSTQIVQNGRTISTAWPSPAATGDTLGDVIDSQRNIMLDLYYSQLGLTNSQVDTTSFAAVPYRSASLVLASSQNSDAVIAQLCADADLVGYHKRDGKEAAREMYKYVGTTTYAWTAEALLDSGSVVPLPVNKFAPAPILNASTDWVTGQPQVVAAINDPSTTSATLTPTNYLQYAPGYLDYSIAVEAQRLANDGYKRHGLKDRTTINAPTWADVGISGLDNNWVGSEHPVSRLAWITARKDVYQCEIDADAFPITAAVGDHIKITDPYMGDFVGLLCEWSFDAMAETVSLKMICDPQLTQRDIIDVQITHADIIDVQITDTNVINVLI